MAHLLEDVRRVGPGVLQDDVPSDRVALQEATHIQDVPVDHDPTVFPSPVTADLFPRVLRLRIRFHLKEVEKRSPAVGDRIPW